MGKLADSVEKAVADRLLRPGETVLVACSGGADSVALAATVAERGDIVLAVGHVDHGLRPQSQDEAAQVAALAKKLGAPFFVERLERLDVHAGGLEASARVARYAALARLANQAGARVVATAHTRRDQAETLLLRLARGAGPGGLAGVRRRRPLAPGIDLVRPLLEVGRADTEEFCRAHRLAYTEDPHNTDPARMRARLRKLWPVLLELNPRLEEALSGAAESLADEDDLLTAMLPADAGLETLRALPLPLLRRALLKHANAAGVHPDRAHLEDLRNLIARGRGSLDLPGGRASIERAELRFLQAGACRPKPRASSAEVAIPGPGNYPWGPKELVVATNTGVGLTVDLARAPFPWTLRPQRPGDRFRPAGGRTKKVADLWIDARIPKAQRAGLAILCDAQGRLFWVEGLREGEPSRGNISSPATFQLCPEMKPVDGRLTVRRRAESCSDTMDPRPDEEPR